jgi:hypothetical protein
MICHWEEGRRKKEEGRGKKEEGRRKKEENFLNIWRALPTKPALCIVSTRHKTSLIILN